MLVAVTIVEINRDFILGTADQLEHKVTLIDDLPSLIDSAKRMKLTSQTCKVDHHSSYSNWLPILKSFTSAVADASTSSWTRRWRRRRRRQERQRATTCWAPSRLLWSDLRLAFDHFKLVRVLIGDLQLVSRDASLVCRHDVLPPSGMRLEVRRTEASLEFVSQANFRKTACLI